MLNAFIKKYFLHIMAWLIIFLLPFTGYFYAPGKIREPDYFFIRMHFFNFLFIASAFYINLKFLAPSFLFEKRRFKFVLYIFLGLCMYILINYFILQNLPHDEILRRDEGAEFRIIPLFIGPAFIYTLCILTSTMMFLYNEQARQKELNKIIALEKTEAELNMLKLQISPHFLFNTMNNIRWLIRKNSGQAEETVMKLSEILHYIIYGMESSKVELKKDIEHIRNYIELQTLRLPVPGNVVFIVADNLVNYQIEPLLFIHFVENAFKYGIDSKSTPDIRFEIGNIENGIFFKANNKILHQNDLLRNEGVGLSNIQRRLELLYLGKHDLQINKTENYFEVNLKLILK